MSHKLKLLYSWFVYSIMFIMPDIPIIMRCRGFFYGLGMIKCGKNFQVTHSVILNTLEKISIGDNVYIANYSQLLANGKIEIKDNVLIGPNVIISSGNHKYEKGKISKTSYQQNVIINENSWISANCTIVGGGSLPIGSILAANSVCNEKLKNLPPNSLYGGVPAKYIKHL